MGHYNPKKDKKIMNKLTREQLKYLDNILDDYQQMIEKCKRVGYCYVEFDTTDDWNVINKIRTKINKIIGE